MTKAEAVGMSGVRDKIPDWVGGGVVGTVAYNIAIAICGKVSGSWVAVIPFAVDNPWPFVIWPYDGRYWVPGGVALAKCHAQERNGQQRWTYT